MESSIAEFLKRKSACELLPTIPFNKKYIKDESSISDALAFPFILPLLCCAFFNHRLDDSRFQEIAAPVSTGFPSGIIR